MSQNNKSKVSIVMGSESDYKTMKLSTKILKSLKIQHEIKIVSAHRTPKRLADYASSAKNRGIRVLIAAAGGSAALPGAIAAWTTLPVIGIPVPSSDLKGIDALLTIAQMPPGVPVACMAVGGWGARNAGYFAASIISSLDSDVERAYQDYKSDLANR